MIRFISLLLLLPFSTFGQEVKFTLSDTTEAKILLTQADSLGKIRETPQALELAYRAKNIFIHTTGEKHDHQIEVWDVIGKIYFFGKNLKKAEASFKSGIDVLNLVYPKSHISIIQFYNNLSIVISSSGDQLEALKYSQLALAFQERLDPKNKIAIAQRHYTIGTAYQYLAKNDSAYYHHSEAYNLRKGIKGIDSIHIATSLRAIGVVLVDLGNPTKGLEYLNKAYSIFEKKHGKENRALNGINNDLGECYKALGEFEKAIGIGIKRLNILLHMPKVDSGAIAIAYNNIGNTYISSGHYPNAEIYISKAINYFPKSYQNHPILGSFYGNLGVTYSHLGNSEKGIAYQKLSLKIRRVKLGKDHADIAYPLHNIASVLLMLEEYEKAIAFSKEAIAIQIKATSEEHFDLVTMYNNLAIAYNGLKNFKLAEINYKKAIKIANLLPEEKEFHLASPIHNLGANYHSQGKYKQAIQLLKQGRSIRESFFTSPHPTISNSYLHLGRTYREMGNYTQAETAFKKALQNLGFSNKSNLKDINSIPDFVQTAVQIGQFYYQWYQKEKDEKYLYHSKNYLNIAKRALLHQSSTLSLTSKTNLSKASHKALSSAASTSFMLHELTDSIFHLHEAFEYAERSKSFLLYEALRKSNARQFAGIPDSLLQKEIDLAVKIAYFDKKIQEHQGQNKVKTDSISLVLVEKQQVHINLHEQLLHTFEDTYPKYFHATKHLNTISLKSVQNDLLQSNQTLLEYVVMDSSILIFLIQKDAFEVREIKKDFPLNQWIEMMTKEGIHGYYTRPISQQTKKLKVKTIKNYSKYAHELYKKLIAPFASQLTENLIIIPDGVLGYLPFEALLSEQPPKIGAFKAYPYLIKKHQISYSYSATLLMTMKTKVHAQHTTKKVLAMAPFYTGDKHKLIFKTETYDLSNSTSLKDSLGILLGSGEEIAEISKIFKGTYLYGKEALLDDFVNAAQLYSIIHLSTHGKADDRVGDYSYIAFASPSEGHTFTKLYARDMYNQKLNADLVVLSACETGVGELKNGEGIISLARSFAFAGAKSIFTTLWSVNDQKTKDILIQFYKNLEEGLPKDAALRKAKLSYLSMNAGKGKYTHPFFWAGLIGIGDMSPIKN